MANWIHARQTKYTAYVTVYILVIVAVLGAANWLANRHNKSVDSTSNKRFSLSDQSIKIVKGLKSDVRITYYDKSGEFPRAKDLLDRYDNLSANLKVEYIDPDKKPALAKAAGIRNYGAIVVSSGLKKEDAKSVTEEEITGAIIRSMKSGERNVCFVTGSGEHGLDDTGRAGYSNAKESVEKSNYKTRAVSLLEKAEIPKDCTVLVIGGPKHDYMEPAAKAVKAYVEGGGRLLMMIDPPLKLGKEESDGTPSLAKLAEGWGVTANKDLALDTSQIGQIFGLSEVVPLVTTYESHAIVREMKETATAFPLARSLEVKSADKVTAEKLFSTSGTSYATTNLSSPEIRIDTKKDRKGPLTLAAAGTYNTGKENNNGRFIIVGSSSWPANNIFRFNGNRDLFLNMISWLSSDEELISIRPKDPEDRRITLNRRQMSFVFFSSVVFLPLIAICGGMLVWWRRR